MLVLINHNLWAKEHDLDIKKLETIENELSLISYHNKQNFTLQDSMFEYQKLMVLYSDYRTQSIRIAKMFLNKIQNRQTLSGDDLYLISRSLETFHNMNIVMMSFAEQYTAKERMLPSRYVRPSHNLATIKSHLLYLSANLIVLDHLIELHQILFKAEPVLRRIIKNNILNNKTDADGKERLKQTFKLLSRIVDRVEDKKFREQVILVHMTQSELKKEITKSDASFMALNEVLNNPTSQAILKGKSKFNISFYELTDSFISFFNNITNEISKLFGNAAGSVAWRTGYFKDDTKAYMRALRSLRPMDILFEKTPFILTDKLIPGHYGHVAIYLGTEAELKELGMWDHPKIAPLQSQIRSGKTILESVRTGVRLTSLNSFMNIDELTIIRKFDAVIDKKLLSTQISKGIDQVGKDYDFNFDISTLDKIVCSEMIYIVFGHVTWPTQYRLGRPTISPDDVIEILFQKNTKFHLIDSYAARSEKFTETQDILDLANLFEFEVRASDGSPATNPNDPKNGFWKRTTKCYNTNNTEIHPVFLKTDAGKNLFTKNCKTTYKEYKYEETLL